MTCLQDTAFDCIITPELWKKGHRTTPEICDLLILPVKRKTTDIENEVEDNCIEV